MPQLARWLMLIKQFDHEVVHRPGTKHGNADGLSRRPISDEPSELPAIRTVCQKQRDTSDTVGGAWSNASSETPRSEYLWLCVPPPKKPSQGTHTSRVRTDKEVPQSLVTIRGP